MATKAKEKKVPKKKEPKETTVEYIAPEDRMATAFYMLAGVVTRNTACMEALLLALQKASEQPGAIEPAEPVTENPNVRNVRIVRTIEDCQKVLVDVCGRHGKDGAFKLLQTHGAEKLSDMDASQYESFISEGKAML
jgi:hypothetical protein